MNSKINKSKEKELLKTYANILGIDESGRGPWAGPIVIAGILIDKNTKYLNEVNDSKKLNSPLRARLYDKLIKNHPYKIVIVENTQIDDLGIGIATTNAMNEIIEYFNAEINLIDGYFKNGTFPFNTKCIIDGDAIHYSIAAASILAKHTRDELMNELDLLYPQYNFKNHKGYGTKEHQQKLKEFGISPIHRKSYKPIQKLILGY